MMNNTEREQPNITLILSAYARIANRVAAEVVNAAPTDRPTVWLVQDAALLHALSSAVQAIGSEYRRQVLAHDVTQSQRTIV